MKASLPYERVSLTLHFMSSVFVVCCMIFFLFGRDYLLRVFVHVYVGMRPHPLFNLQIHLFFASLFESLVYSRYGRASLTHYALHLPKSYVYELHLFYCSGYTLRMRVR